MKMVKLPVRRPRPASRRAAFGLLVALALAAGCARRGTVLPPGPGEELAPGTVLDLGSPVAAVFADGAGLLALEMSGARVLRFDDRLVPVETIPLTRRLAVPRGIAADRFYIYCYDENALYRQRRDDPRTAVWLSNVRVTGLAGYSSGEMLVADADRNVVWYKTVFGESRRFVDGVDVVRPGPMATLPGGRFAVLTRGRELLLFNRAGIVDRRLELELEFDLLAVNESGTVYLARTGTPSVVAFGERTVTRFELPPGVQPTGIALLDGRLVVLDNGARLVSFTLP